ncbi:MAG: hypothetical protein F082_1802 [bacterium F082]|nr:MAG: hypothetical protein F082_1802 [bacterium F082]
MSEFSDNLPPFLQINNPVSKQKSRRKAGL